MRKAAAGPFRQVAESGRVPLLDVGTVRAIRAGSVLVAPDVEGVEGPTVRFTDGQERAFDAIVFATGYRPRVPATNPAASGQPRGIRGARPGLYYCGFHVSPQGMFRAIGIEAQAIAREVASGLPS